jgi:hypothetical protein
MSQLLTWALLVLCIALVAMHFNDIKKHGNGQ